LLFKKSWWHKAGKVNALDTSEVKTSLEKIRKDFQMVPAESANLSKISNKPSKPPFIPRSGGFSLLKNQSTPLIQQ
jgi:hypothetical protein